MIKAVGFTGPCEGMNQFQEFALEAALKAFREVGAAEFHHGDCVGCDAKAHEIAQKLNYLIIIHPPLDEKHRAFCTGAKVVLPAKSFLLRNKDIVFACNVLIATPTSEQEALRSGTWATVRYARTANREVLVIPPDVRETSPL
jgi:hypothetical protein